MSTHSDDLDPATETRRAPQGFRERHALKILGTIMVVMFTIVIVVQAGC